MFTVMQISFIVRVCRYVCVHECRGNRPNIIAAAASSGWQFLCENYDVPASIHFCNAFSLLRMSFGVYEMSMLPLPRSLLSVHACADYIVCECEYVYCVCSALM